MKRNRSDVLIYPHILAFWHFGILGDAEIDSVHMRSRNLFRFLVDTHIVLRYDGRVACNGVLECDAVDRY